MKLLNNFPKSPLIGWVIVPDKDGRKLSMKHHSLHLTSQTSSLGYSLILPVAISKPFIILFAHKVKRKIGLLGLSSLSCWNGSVTRQPARSSAPLIIWSMMFRPLTGVLTCCTAQCPAARCRWRARGDVWRRRSRRGSTWACSRSTPGLSFGNVVRFCYSKFYRYAGKYVD